MLVNPKQQGTGFSVQPTTGQTGQVKGREVKPISHNTQTAGGAGGISVGTIMLIVGICLWACGTSPQMILAGKILVGLSLGGTCCAICCLACLIGIAAANGGASRVNANA
jgi:hypothetical protein